MSGGHYEYAYARIDAVAMQIARERHGNKDTGWKADDESADREKIACHLLKVAFAMRSLEWFDSADSSDWARVRAAFRDCGLNFGDEEK